MFLKALGFPDKAGENVIRISLMESVTLDEITQFSVFFQIAIDAALRVK